MPEHVAQASSQFLSVDAYFAKYDFDPWVTSYSATTRVLVLAN